MHTSHNFWNRNQRILKHTPIWKKNIKKSTQKSLLLGNSEFLLRKCFHAPVHWKSKMFFEKNKCFLIRSQFCFLGVALSHVRELIFCHHLCPFLKRLLKDVSSFLWLISACKIGNPRVILDISFSPFQPWLVVL